MKPTPFISPSVSRLISSAMFILLTSGLGLKAFTHHGTVQLLVKWKGGPRSLSAAEGNARIGAKLKCNLDALGWQIVELPPRTSPLDGLNAYRALDAVAIVERDQTIPSVVAGTIPNDPMFSQQWHLPRISATNAWMTTTGSAEVVVAVFDSGVDYTHPDLATNLWRNPGESGLDANGQDKATNGVDDDGSGYADDVFGINVMDGNGDPMDTGWILGNSTYYHGTAVAGVTGAVGGNTLGIAGINWSVKILSIKIVGGDDASPKIFRSFSTGAMLAAWNYVLEMKERGVNIRVTSHSEGLTAYGTAVREAIIAAGNAGILTVIAADNNAIDHDVFSTYANVQNLAPILYVAATDQNDQLASFADYGKSTVHLGAPGVSILTTAPGANYQTISGSSFSCPLVAGAAALVLAVRPDLNVNQLKAALLGSVDQPTGLQGRLISSGRLNVARALEYATNANNAPIVITALPAGQRTPTEFPIQVTFSCPMDRASVENALAVNPSITGSITWADDSSSFTFRTGTPFDRTTNYTVRIRGSAQDESGRTLDGNFNRVLENSPADDFVWSFRFPVLNDNFADAHAIAGGSGVTNGNAQYTILEHGELDHGFSAYGLASVWYRWTAPDPGGWFTFELTNHVAFDSLIAIYTGDELATLIPIGTNDNYGVRISSRVSIPAIAGTNYSIEVVGKSAIPNLIPFTSSSPFTLSWYSTPAPLISSFSPQSGYPGQSVTLNGANLTGATRVLFSGVPANFTFSINASFSDLQLIATVPPDAITGPITIETAHGNVSTLGSFTALVRPIMTIRSLSGTNLVELSWPSTSGFTLQRADSPGVGANWTSASFISTGLTNNIRYVSISLVPSNRFFRLVKP